jgi:hypothetical protein
MTCVDLHRERRLAKAVACGRRFTVRMYRRRKRAQDAAAAACSRATLDRAESLAAAFYDCLRQLGRSTGGQNYKELAQSIRRLAATLVITNIRDQDQPDEGSFRIPKKYARMHLTRDNPDGSTLGGFHSRGHNAFTFVTAR